MHFHLLSLIVFFFGLNSIESNQLPYPFKQCSARSMSHVLQASVNLPCRDGYCIVYKNSTATLKFTFLNKKKAAKLRAKVIATIGTVDNDFNVPNHDVCQQLGCPLKPNTTYTYSHNFFVSQKYPTLKVNPLRYFLIDGRGRDVVCLSMPVMITENVSKQ